MIEVENFSKSYKNSFSIKNVSFSVSAGEITALLGANGSGKTTIIKALCGFHYPDEGNVYISDEKGMKTDISEIPEKAMELTGYVPEISRLPQDMYVKHFLDYAAEIHGLSDEERKIAVEKVTKECQLESVLSKKIKQLSKGFKQRVSFAQALIHNPTNLVLDEPISGLDPVQIVQMRKLICKLSKTKAILISTHILQEVSTMCGKIVVIAGNGHTARQIACGTEQEVLKNSGCSTIEELIIKSQETADTEGKNA